MVHADICLPLTTLPFVLYGSVVAMDFLEMFDDVDQHVAEQECPQDSQVASSLKRVNSALVRVDSKSRLELACTVGSYQKRKKLGFSGKEGGMAGKAMSWYRHFCKVHKKVRTTEASILDALVQLQQKVRTGNAATFFTLKRLKKRKDLKAKHSLVLQAKMKCGAGNRYARRFGMTDFLEVAFGEKSGKARDRFHLIGDIAKHFHVSPPTVRLMRTTVAASVMTKQMHLLSRLLALCRRSSPVVVSTRYAWDETAQDIQVQLEGNDASSRSAWKVVVQKLKVKLQWRERSMVLNLVGNLDVI